MDDAGGKRNDDHEWTAFGHRRLPDEAASRKAEGPADVCFLPRDNGRRSRAIEHAYRQAFRDAKREIVIANAYFFPGYGFLRDLRAAARRGVKVQLIFQGEPDTPMALIAARWLYRYLVDAGVHIFEYCERPFHGKVAVIDEEWSTVGSSNLDWRSFVGNNEVNAVIVGDDFGDTMERMFQRDVAASREITAEAWAKRPLLQRTKETLARLFEAWW